MNLAKLHFNLLNFFLIMYNKNMKKLFLVIFSFLFIGCATIGGGLLLSACGSSKTISGGGISRRAK